MAIADMFAFLKPASHPPKLSDAAEIDEKYRYWRIRIFYSMYFGYLFYYFTRKSLSFITPMLTTELNLTKSDIGHLFTMLAITYGCSKFLGGILTDRSNPRYIMSVGLILTGICNIIFGFSSSLVFFTILCAANGYFQGWGWPACTKQLTHWYSHSERGKWWSIACTSHTLGGFFIAYITAYSAVWFGWRWGMFVPGILCIAAGLWVWERQRDVPESLGLPPIEQFKQDAEIEVSVEKEKNKEPTGTWTIRQILFGHVLNNPYVWLLAASYFFTYIIRDGVNNWGPLYLTESRNFDPKVAAVCVSWFEIGGFLGMLVAGWGSDRLFQGRRVPGIVIFSLVLIFALGGLWYLENQTFLSSSLLMGVIGFFVFGPQMLVGLAAAEFVSKRVASTANGFAGFCAYLGAAVAGYPLIKVAETLGWYSFVVTLMVCAALIAAILLPIWSAKRGVRVSDLDQDQNKDEPLEDSPLIHERAAAT